MNNSLTLIGYVGQTPETKSFAGSGNKLVKFSIAVKTTSRKGDKPMWVDVTAWNGLGDRVIATITKGREVALTGRLGISSFTKTGAAGETIEVHKPVLNLTSFHLCGNRR